jgi:acetamidase/formamidase
MAVHELRPEPGTVHGAWSRELPPVLTVEPGDTVRFETLDAGWGFEPPPLDPAAERRRFEAPGPGHDGHALCGPVEIRGARAGQTLVVRIGELHPGPWGLTVGGGFPTPLNDRLGLSDGEGARLVWELADGLARDQHGRELELRPFLGVMGMPPAEPGLHSTIPPRACGGNMDCKELVAGTTLYLPIPVDGALFSCGDGHGRQGDGEVSQLAIECPFHRADLTFELDDRLELEAPVAWTPEAWLTLGFADDLDEAMARALDAMLSLMGREVGLARPEALAYASLVVDLRVTQVVNEAVGVHAVLPHGALVVR